MSVRSQLAVLVLAASLTACASPSTPPEAVVPANEPLVRGVSYVGVAVSDIERSSTFYKDALGLSEVDRHPLAAVPALDQLNGGRPVTAQTRLLRGDRGQIRLMQFATPSREAQAALRAPVQGPGITHVCHQSPDTKPIFGKLVAAGAKPLSRTGDLVQLRPDVPVRYAYLRDWDGTMMETEQIIAENLAWTYHMRHVAIATTDIERAVSFYTTLLGKPPRERRFNLVNKTLDLVSDLDDVKLNVAWYQINNLELEVWQYLNPPPVGPSGVRPFAALGYNLIVLDVANVDAALQLAREAGATPVGKPGIMDGASVAFVRDPDGNLLGLQHFEPHSVFSVAGLTGPA